MTDFLYTDARWTEHFVEVNDPHKEGHHVRFYFERTWVGLTEEERNHARQNVTYSQLAMTISEWADAVQIETEQRLMEKNK